MRFDKMDAQTTQKALEIVDDEGKGFIFCKK